MHASCSLVSLSSVVVTDAFTMTGGRKDPHSSHNFADSRLPGSWQQPQQSTRRPSYAESMEMRAPSITALGTEVTHARSQTFPAPPLSYLNRDPQAFAHSQALGPSTGPAPNSPSAYGPSQHVPVEQGGSYPHRVMTQQDPLRFQSRRTALDQRVLVEGSPSQSV